MAFLPMWRQAITHTKDYFSSISTFGNMIGCMLNVEHVKMSVADELADYMKWLCLTNRVVLWAAMLAVTKVMATSSIIRVKRSNSMIWRQEHCKVPSRQPRDTNCCCSYYKVAVVTILTINWIIIWIWLRLTCVVECCCHCCEIKYGLSWTSSLLSP